MEPEPTTNEAEWVAAHYVIDAVEYDVVGNRDPDGTVWYEVYEPSGACISDDNPNELPTEDQVREYIAAGFRDA